MTINENIHNHILKQVSKGGSWDGLGRVKLDFDPALNIGRVSFSNPNPTLDPKKSIRCGLKEHGPGRANRPDRALNTSSAECKLQRKRETRQKDSIKL